MRKKPEHLEESTAELSFEKYITMSDKVKLYVAMAGGIISAVITDLATKGIGYNQSMFINFSEQLTENLRLPNLTIGLIILFTVFLFFGVVQIVIHEPKSTFDSYTRGMLIFSLLGIAPVNRINPEDRQLPDNKQINQSTTTLSEGSLISSSLYLFSELDNLQDCNRPSNKEKIAILNDKPIWISSTKPTSSFINRILNTVNTTPIRINYIPNEIIKIEIICWFDNYAGYRYAEIKFISGATNTQSTYWIPAGRRSYSSNFNFKNN